MADYLALKAELDGEAYQGLSDEAAADLLNAPDASRPAPKPITIGGLVNLFSAESLTKLVGRPALPFFRADVVAQDRAAVLNWIGLSYKVGDVTQAELAAVAAALQETVPGPSRAIAVFGSPVSRHEVARARGL